MFLSTYQDFYVPHPWNNLQSNLHVTVSSLVAAAIVWMSELPAKLNPVILPLMASIKREQVYLKLCLLFERDVIRDV